MSEELNFDAEELVSPDEAAAADDDYEEISSDEVDRVVEALETLMATVDSENIRYFLEEATNSIYLLIYDDDTASEAA
jgi:hypothetical protein